MTDKNKLPVPHANTRYLAAEYSLVQNNLMPSYYKPARPAQDNRDHGLTLMVAASMLPGLPDSIRMEFTGNLTRKELTALVYDIEGLEKSAYQSLILGFDKLRVANPHFAHPRQHEMAFHTKVKTVRGAFKDMGDWLPHQVVFRKQFLAENMLLIEGCFTVTIKVEGIYPQEIAHDYTRPPRGNHNGPTPRTNWNQRSAQQHQQHRHQQNWRPIHARIGPNQHLLRPHPQGQATQNADPPIQPMDVGVQPHLDDSKPDKHAAVVNWLLPKPTKPKKEWANKASKHQPAPAPELDQESDWSQETHPEEPPVTPQSASTKTSKKDKRSLKNRTKSKKKAVTATQDVSKLMHM